VYGGRVLLEKLKSHTVTLEILCLLWAWRFITVLIKSRICSLSRARPSQPTFSRSVLKLFFHLRLGFQPGIFPSSLPIKKSRDSSAGIALGYGLDDWGSRVRFPVGTGNFSLHYRVQNGSGAHPASSPMGTRGSFPGVRAAGA
jgi:hypothetical protein